MGSSFLIRLIGKDSDAGRDWGQEEKGTTEDEMVEGHHRLNGHEFVQGRSGPLADKAGESTHRSRSGSLPE